MFPSRAPVSILEKYPVSSRNARRSGKIPPSGETPSSGRTFFFITKLHNNSPENYLYSTTVAYYFSNFSKTRKNKKTFKNKELIEIKTGRTEKRKQAFHTATDVIGFCCPAFFSFLSFSFPITF